MTGGAGGWGVGVNRLVGEPVPFVPDVRLFTFLDDLPSEPGTVA